MNGVRHFLDLDRIPAETLRGILSHAARMKAGRMGRPKGWMEPDRPAADRILAMIFEKPSTRTRLSFDSAMRQLGGETIVVRADELQINRGESIADTAKILSANVDAIMMRTGKAQNLADLAANASVPVINGLTDDSHPCQVMADVLTFEEKRGPIRGRKLAWVGDGNNMATSLIHAAVLFGFRLDLACPAELQPDAKVLKWAAERQGQINVSHDPAQAAADADCLITDTWVSMGMKDAERRHKILAPYQVNAALMAKAAKDAIFMHCLPAHRGEEVTSEVIDGPQSVVFDEAENRLHAQKAILAWCFGA
ncbi:ornithine carbamoyltransferase [Ferrovibrio sp.]|uniref:ornithine carbamoyltransferase n=1 Tax=Ferrovibrio sp. TaxID=1917215 RepID=UPI002620504F|nr:ornithine carbamoyltransferase [Ferrovibrio sp.]